MPSTHIRCRITASFLATAILALAMPRRFAMASPAAPQAARSADHFLPRTRSVRAASTRPARASSSPPPSQIWAAPLADLGTDSSDDIRLAGLISPLQGQEAAAGRRQPPPAGRLVLDAIEDPLGQPGEFLDHARGHGQERLQQCHEFGLFAGHLAHPGGKRLAARRAELDAVLAGDPANDLLASRLIPRTTFSIDRL